MGAEAGISVPLSVLRGDFRGTQLFGSASYVGLVGLGFFVGAGTNASLGLTQGPLQTGVSDPTLVVQGGAAFEAGGELQVQLGDSPALSGGAGPRVGYGAYAAGGVKYSATLATPELCY